MLSQHQHVDTTDDEATYERMAKDETAAQPPASKTTTPEILPIGRDSSFVRIAADDIIVVHRKSDIQISLLAEGPEPVKQAMPTKRKDGLSIQSVELADSFTELARVGLPQNIAFNMAMNIVEAAIAAGNVPIGTFRERFLAMLDEHQGKTAPKTAPALPKRKR